VKGLFISRDQLLVGDAKDLLIEAAACLTLPSPERKAEALVLAAVAMLKIVKSDPSEGARDRAEAIVRSIRVKEESEL
jgi:hypothetical protein